MLCCLHILFVFVNPSNVNVVLRIILRQVLKCTAVFEIQLLSYTNQPCFCMYDIYKLYHNIYTSIILRTYMLHTYIYMKPVTAAVLLYIMDSTEDEVLHSEAATPQKTTTMLQTVDVYRYTAVPDTSSVPSIYDVNKAHTYIEPTSYI